MKYLILLLLFASCQKEYECTTIMYLFEDGKIINVQEDKHTYNKKESKKLDGSTKQLINGKYRSYFVTNCK